MSLIAVVFRAWWLQAVARWHGWRIDVHVDRLQRVLVQAEQIKERL